MRQTSRQPRALVFALTMAIAPQAVSAMPSAPSVARAAPVAVAFAPGPAERAPTRPDDVAVQIASLHARTPWAVRPVGTDPAVAAVDAAAEPHGGAVLPRIAISATCLLLAGLLLHQRTVQARASGPRPTGEA